MIPRRHILLPGETLPPDHPGPTVFFELRAIDQLHGPQGVPAIGLQLVAGPQRIHACVPALALVELVDKLLHHHGGAIRPGNVSPVAFFRQELSARGYRISIPLAQALERIEKGLAGDHGGNGKAEA
ncbi:MAG: hypothetical protein JXQ29_18705 [Planctomycetes bacterium]|nr:hypothetical protein [Planctomycetota bacterium]